VWLARWGGRRKRRLEVGGNLQMAMADGIYEIWSVPVMEVGLG